jgi:signal transduction histidine kinase
MTSLSSRLASWAGLIKHYLPTSRMAISLPLALAAALLLIGINELGYERSASAVKGIAAAQDTRNALNKLLQQMLDAETGLRGYLLTGDERYLEPYNTAVNEVNQTLDGLRTFYLSDGGNLVPVTMLSRHVSRKLAEMDLSLKLRKQGNEEAWRFVMRTDVGKEHMDAIRDQSATLIRENSIQVSASEQQIMHSLQVSRLGIAITAAIGLIAFYLYLQQSNALKLAVLREQLVLERERDRLEDLVRDRTASLAKLATYLQQVRENERAHLARELHDELGALLTAAKLDVARIKSRLGDNAPEATQRLQHLTETLNSGIALKRRIVEDLRPSSLSNLGLLPALEILTREFAQRADLEINTEFDEVDLPAAAQLTLYRMVQEALTNISKYAQAQQVNVLLQNMGSHVVLQVNDDGNGFNPQEVGASSHGLDGMRHRVEAEGGRLHVDSALGQGTRITATLPSLPPVHQTITEAAVSPAAAGQT